MDTGLLILQQQGCSRAILLYRDTVAFLLQCQASTQIADSSGSYPLHLAAWKGDLDIVKLLVERGPSRANVNQQVCYIVWSSC